MIYFDNSATTLQKPGEVSRAAAWAVTHLGNAGRSFHGPAMDAARAIQNARETLAALVKATDARFVAFTSGATESLNLAAASLLNPGDAVITTVLEHNAVLRPLYRLGCELSFVDCDDAGRLCLDMLPKLLRPNTRCVFCTHGSNVIGSVSNVAEIGNFCRAAGISLILDAAQTLGVLEITANMADVICFTGHKGLLGPQGTGGIIAGDDLPFRVVKTGGTGSDSFAPCQAPRMPGVFEAGTANAHGLCALEAGTAFISRIGPDAIRQKEMALTRRFLEGVEDISGVRVYGADFSGERLPIAALNIGELSSEEAALLLWERYGIATRPGIHCAPLLHRRFGTAGQGMVRFSFGYFNTPEEIDAGVRAVAVIAKGL